MFFKKIDLVSPQISLYFNNKKRHSSFIGGFFSLIFILNFLGILIQYSAFNTLPNKHSLNIYRNFDENINAEFFNENNFGIFHFFYLYNKNNNINNDELIKYKNLKNGIIHIYMLNSLNIYDFNSTNFQNYDHWVYDSCNNYALEEDLKYDYSFSFCIHYYYNSIHKTYYSINDKTNFKWPFAKESNNISGNSYFTIFVEKCSNNSLINNIYGKCYSEEKINDFLLKFDSIFISFVDNKLNTSNEKNTVKKYSHKIHNHLKNNEKYFNFHDIEFSRFNYEENGVFYKKLKINSFMLEDHKISRIYNGNGNNILTAYSFSFKKYYNEFRKLEHKFFTIFRLISSNVVFVYIIFYVINLFFNEITQTRNFISYINNNNAFVQRNINYDRSKIFSTKSILNSNESNENNINSLQSSYFGNVKSNNNMSNNFFNSFNKDIISKFNKKPEMTDYPREKEENNYSKKSENIVFINNGTFMDTTNLNSKNKFNLNFNIFEKTKSMKLFQEKSDLNDLKYNNKIYSHRNSKKESYINIFNHNIMSKKVNNKTKENNSIRNDFMSDNDSKQKIMNNSSISLLKIMNSKRNFQSNNSNNLFEKNELSPINKKDKKISINSPYNLFTNHIKNLYKNNNKGSANNLINSNIDINYPESPKHSIKNVRFDREKNKFSFSFIKNNGNNKGQEKNKSENKRKKSLLNEIIDKTNNQISLHKKSKEKHKTSILLNKEKKKQVNEENIKKKKFDINYSPNNSFYNPRKINKNTFNIEKDSILTTKILLNYLCLCKKDKNNGIRIMSDFRKRLLSEEYLYIVHLSLLIFKKNLESKSNLEKNNLMEELYHDY